MQPQPKKRDPRQTIRHTDNFPAVRPVASKTSTVLSPSVSRPRSAHQARQSMWNQVIAIGVVILVVGIIVGVIALKAAFGDAPITLQGLLTLLKVMG
jgi:hypothetical protein